MNDFHRPSPDFVDALGRELQSAVRRHETLSYKELKRPRHGFHIPTRPLLMIVVVAATSALLGSAGAFAVVRQRLARTADANVASAQTQLELAELRQTSFHFEFPGPKYDFHFAFFGDVDLALETGDDSDTPIEEPDDDTPDLESMAADLTDQALETGVSKRGLDVAEVTESGLPPNDSLTAPLVDNRDFVTERLELDREILGAQLGLLTFAWQDAAGSGNVDQAEIEPVATASSKIELIDEKLSIRQAFLDGDITVVDAKWQEMHEQAKHRKTDALISVARAARRSTNVTGDKDELTMSRLLLDLVSADLEFQLASQELKTIERKLGINTK